MAPRIVEATREYVRQAGLTRFSDDLAPDKRGWRENVEAGGLMSYGNDGADTYRRAATYVDRILSGANPGELPIQIPTKFELTANLKTTRTLGLMIPPAILAHADEVIE